MPEFSKRETLITVMPSCVRSGLDVVTSMGGKSPGRLPVVYACGSVSAAFWAASATETVIK
jgi:hypothetical protein